MEESRTIVSVVCRGEMIEMRVDQPKREGQDLVLYNEIDSGTRGLIDKDVQYSTVPNVFRYYPRVLLGGCSRRKGKLKFEFLLLPLTHSKKLPRGLSFPQTGSELDHDTLSNLGIAASSCCSSHLEVVARTRTAST